MNALMRLNQLKPGLQYKLISQTGPVHVPVFTMAVEVDGKAFEASGPSKRTAKLHVAVKVSCTSGCGRACYRRLDKLKRLSEKLKEKKLSEKQKITLSWLFIFLVKPITAVPFVLKPFTTWSNSFISNCYKDTGD